MLLEVIADWAPHLRFYYDPWLAATVRIFKENVFYLSIQKDLS